MPFGSHCQYKDFAACVAANSDKDNPQGYCATVQKATEGKCKRMATIDAVQFRNAPPAKLDGIDICRDHLELIGLRAADDGSGDTPAPPADNSPGTLFGHFSTFNDWYQIDSFWEGKFLERIAPG